MENQNAIFIDIETDGLMPSATRVHCIGSRIPSKRMMVLGLGDHAMSLKPEVEKEAAFRFKDWTLEVLPLDAFLLFITHMKSDAVFVGHNLIGFDYPFLEKFHSEELDGFFSRVDHTFDTMIAARLCYPDRMEQDAKERTIPPQQWGHHSLKAWGNRLGVKKDTYGDDRTDWSEVSVDMLLYCLQDLAVTEAIFKHLNPPEDAMKMEQEFAHVIQLQQQNGLQFNEAKAAALYSRMVGKRAILEQELQHAFPPTLLQMKTKVKHIPFNPGSRQQIAKRLEAKGWKPTEFSESGLATVDETVLASVDIPEAKLCAEYLKLQKRIGQLYEGDKGWMKLVKNGRIHGDVITLGTVTSRCAHRNPNMAQIPKEKEFRELFEASVGNVMVGIDCKGLQLRCLAHYMRDDDYIKAVSEGDPHAVNQVAAGLETRDKAKTFIYAFLFGAGDEKLGSIVGGDKKAGKKLRSKFLTGIPSLSNLIANVQETIKERGWLVGLDVRHLPIRSVHAGLNTLLMAAEAVIVKTFTVRMHHYLSTNVPSCKQVAHVHDEIQFEVPPQFVEKVKEIAQIAIEETTEILKFRCPLAVDVKVGSNWSETH